MSKDSGDMPGYGPETFGQLHAQSYDEEHDPGTTDEAVALLWALAQQAPPFPALEFAIGTGRLALPLIERGLEVHGIEASAAMAERLREKPRGKEVPVTIGDMAYVQAPGAFGLVFLMFNTLYNLTTQAAQLSCVANAAGHLTAGGLFVVEAISPIRFLSAADSQLRTRALSSQHLELEAWQHDWTQQSVHLQRVRLTADGLQLTPLPLRYVWPGELDLMAQLAGLVLKHRWSNWQQAPFDADSDMHISVYEKVSG